MAADNKTLGRFVLDGIAPAPRGIPQIEVAFDIDSNGILNVSAKDKATGKEQNITIKNATNLSDEEVEKMKQEAEANADDDQKKKALIDKKNEAETLIFSTRKAVESASDKFDDKAKEEIKEALKELEEEKDKQDVTVESLDEKLQSANKIAQKHGEALYKAVQDKESKEKDSDKKTDSNKSSSDKKSKSSSDAEEGEVVKE